jgi:hypothetical protein
VRVWDLANRASCHTLSGHTSRVKTLVVAPDGSRLALRQRRQSGAGLELGYRCTTHVAVRRKPLVPPRTDIDNDRNRR